MTLDPRVDAIFDRPTELGLRLAMVVAHRGDLDAPAPVPSWIDLGRRIVAHDDTADLPTGFDDGRHWWMWPDLPGSIATHGYEGRYIVVEPDRKHTLVHLGTTGADVRHDL